MPRPGCQAASLAWLPAYQPAHASAPSARPSPPALTHLLVAKNPFEAWLSVSSPPFIRKTTGACSLTAGLATMVRASSRMMQMQEAASEAPAGGDIVGMQRHGTACVASGCLGAWVPEWCGLGPATGAAQRRQHSAQCMQPQPS